jgi:predicted nucleotidyltransferase component of viral defense system
MLTQPQLQRFARESGIRNLEIVEKEVVLTYFLQLLSERGFLADMAFKGGTCIRKTWLGPNGRFSTDVDFTATRQEKSADDFVLQLAEITAQPFHGVQFEIDMGDKGWYEADDGVSWGVLPNYRHDLSNGVVKLQVSNRETPTLPLDSRRQLEISYFKHLPFKPADLPCLCIEEILAEKIRAAYQRNKPRDIWDLDHFANRPLPEALVRKLVIIKLWQVRDSFSPERWNAKLADAKARDWDDLRQLVRGGVSDPKQMLGRCARRFGFLADMNADEAALAADPYQRKHDIHQKLVSECNALALGHRLT